MKDSNPDDNIKNQKNKNDHELQRFEHFFSSLNDTTETDEVLKQLANLNFSDFEASKSNNKSNIVSDDEENNLFNNEKNLPKQHKKQKQKTNLDINSHSHKMHNKKRPRENSENMDLEPDENSNISKNKRQKTSVKKLLERINITDNKKNQQKKRCIKIFSDMSVSEISNNLFKNYYPCILPTYYPEQISQQIINDQIKKLIDNVNKNKIIKNENNTIKNSFDYLKEMAQKEGEWIEEEKIEYDDRVSNDEENEESDSNCENNSKNTYPDERSDEDSNEDDNDYYGNNNDDYYEDYDNNEGY